MRYRPLILLGVLGIVILIAHLLTEKQFADWKAIDESGQYQVEQYNKWKATHPDEAAKLEMNHR